MERQYLVIPFCGLAKAGDTAQVVATQLEASLNGSQGKGAFRALAPITIMVQPGCISRLFGAQPFTTRFDQVVMGPALQSAIGGPHLAERPLGIPNPAHVSPGPVQSPRTDGGHSTPDLFESLVQFWSGLSKRARALTLGTASLVLIGWLVLPGSNEQPSNGPVVHAPAPAATAPAHSRPLESSPALQQSNTPSAAPIAAERPAMQLGDRWVSDVTDHQDARLNYRSERVVVEADTNRVVTTVRTLKNNYTRSIEYTADWGLLSSRLPNGSATTYSPALPYMKFPAEPGRGWSQEVVETAPNGAQKVHDIRAQIGTWETVTVPAGTFRALRIELRDNVMVNGALVSSGTDVSWYVPAVKRSVKSEETSQDAATGERRKRTIVLVEYSVQ